jgi:SAM-dependent methyltransferase
MATTSSRPGAWSACAARLYDPFLALGERRGMAARRRALLAGAHGRVLEIGAGTGGNLAAYPAGLDALVLTEPEPGMRARLQRRVERGGGGAAVVDAPAEALPFADGEFDTVVCTLVLCTVADAQAAVQEIRRVLRPGGRLLFVEHVRADDRRLARRQDRLAGPWRAFAAGCRCNRPTLDLLRAHFPHVAAERAEWRGMPRIVHPLVAGHAEAER